MATDPALANGPGPSRRRVSRPWLPRARFLCVAIVILASDFASAAADPIAYFTGPIYGGQRGLLQIDLSDGDVIEVGPYALDATVGAVAFAPDGTLYGIGLDIEGAGYLLTLDPLTGASTVLVELALPDPAHHFDSMTTDACGRIWAGGFLGPDIPSLRRSVLAIDPVTGTLQEVASGPAETGPFGLAASGETLFTVREGALSVLDPATGEITPIGGTFVPHLDIDFAADGYLWGVSSPSPFPPPPLPPGFTFRVDPQTGEVKGLAENDHFLYGGTAIGPPPGLCGSPLPIPAVSPLALAALAILLAAAGAALARRRDPAPAGREIKRPVQPTFPQGSR